MLIYELVEKFSPVIVSQHSMNQVGRHLGSLLHRSPTKSSGQTMTELAFRLITTTRNSMHVVEKKYMSFFLSKRIEIGLNSNRKYSMDKTVEKVSKEWLGGLLPGFLRQAGPPRKTQVPLPPHSKGRSRTGSLGWLCSRLGCIFFVKIKSTPNFYPRKNYEDLTLNFGEGDRRSRDEDDSWSALLSNLKIINLIIVKIWRCKTWRQPTNNYNFSTVYSEKNIGKTNQTS